VRFILQAGSVPESTWRDLAALLQPEPNPAAGLRRVLFSEAANASSANLFLFTRPEGDATWLTYRRAGVFYLPNATHRLVVEQFSRLADVAAEGRSEGLQAHHRAIDQALRAPVFKNPEGHILAQDAVSGGVTFVQAFWRVDDQRRALLAEVQAKLAEAEKKEATK
jgi:hypothetical protein